MGGREYKKETGAGAEQQGLICGEPELLYELALNGIGGDTVSKVARNLSRQEILQWAEYRRRRGSLNVGRRVEQAVANMMAYHVNGQIKDESKHIHPLELMPHEDDLIIAFEEQLEDY